MIVMTGYLARHGGRVWTLRRSRARAVRIEHELARRGIKLRRVGAELIGPCPTCGGEDRFGVNLSKQVFNCRGCGGRGDVISLVHLLDGVDFGAACQALSGDHPVTSWRPLGRPAHSPSHEAQTDEQTHQRAAQLWREAVPIEGTLAELYLRSLPPNGRGLEIPDGVSGRVLRFHPQCPFLDYGRGPPARITVPAMVALFRSISDDKPMAIHRTALAPDGRKVKLAKPKLSLGPTSSAAIKLTANEDVTYGLTIAEGIETALAGMAHGFQPAWVLGSSGAIRRFPVLSGINCLTILVDNDTADQNSRRAGPDAAHECSSRWTAAGREVHRVVPDVAGTDMADLDAP